MILEDISIYAADSDDNVWVLAIKGAVGAGKSLFARNLVQQVIEKQKEILKSRNEKPQENGEASDVQFKIILTSCNAVVQ